MPSYKLIMKIEQQKRHQENLANYVSAKSPHLVYGNSNALATYPRLMLKLTFWMLTKTYLIEFTVRHTFPLLPGNLTIQQLF